MRIINKEYFDKGKRGYIYTANVTGQEQKVVIKERNPTSDADTIEHEAQMLQKVNTLGIGPRFIAYTKGQLIREFIEGERIEDYLQHASIQEVKNIIAQVLAQCKKMDDAGINKFEMTHPYKHILITGKEKLRVVMIDFERCKYTQKPKNVTQICQYIARLAPLLASRGMTIDQEKIKKIGQDYKQQGYDKNIYASLLEVFST